MSSSTTRVYTGTDSTGAAIAVDVTVSTTPAPIPVPQLITLTVQPAQIPAGQFVQVFATLSSPALSPVSVALSYLGPGSGPAALVIGVGLTQGSALVATRAAQAGTLFITGSLAGVSRMAALTVTYTPPPPNRLNVRNFGAIGNGIADDRSAIQQCLDTAKSGQEVYLPPGQYKISDTLFLSKPGVTLLGDGPDAAILLHGGQRGLYVGTTTVVQQDVAICNLKMIGRPGIWLAGGNVNHAILIDGALNTLVQNVQLVGVGQGVYSIGSSNGTVHDQVVVRGWGGTAFGLWSGAVMRDCLAVQDDPNLANSSGHGIYAHAGGTNITIDRTRIENVRSLGMQIYGESLGLTIGPVTLRDCIFKNCNGAFTIANYPAEAARAQHTVLQRCQFLETYGGNAVTIQQGDGLEFSDCIIDKSPNFGLSIGVWPNGYTNAVLRNMSFRNNTIRNCAYGLGIGGTAANPGRFENVVVQGTRFENCPRTLVAYDNQAGITVLP